MDQGLALNPNAAQSWALSGWLRVWRGEPDLALDHLAHAMRLSPFDPLMYGIHGAMAYAHLPGVGPDGFDHGGTLADALCVLLCGRFARGGNHGKHKQQQGLHDRAVSNRSTILRRTA